MDDALADRKQAIRQAADSLVAMHVAQDPLALQLVELDHGHLHPVPTFVLPLIGSHRLYWRGGRMDADPGTAIAISPCTRHRHETGRHRSVSFHLGFKGPVCDIAIEVDGHRHEAHIRGGPLREIADAVLAAENDRRLDHLRHLITLAITAERLPQPQHSPAVVRMTHYLWRNFDRPIATADIIAAGGLGASQSHRLFAQAYGHGPGAECRRLRLETARYLLLCGLSVEATSQRCGFTDRRSFTRAFRRCFGQPPNFVSKHRRLPPVPDLGHG